MKKLILGLLILTVNFQKSYSQIIPESRFKFLTNVGLEFERPDEYDHIIDVGASPYFLTSDKNEDPDANLKPQNNFEKNNYIKAGIGFYSIYENNILTDTEINIAAYPGFALGLGFTWEISNSFLITWENLIRSKVFEVEYIGLDTTTNKMDVAFYRDFEFFNFDIKAIAKKKLINFKEVFILGFGGIGATINFHYGHNYELNNKNVLLKSSNERLPETPEFFNNTGFIAESGVEIKQKNFSLSLGLLIELNTAYLTDVGNNKSIFTQINIMYNF